MEIVFTKMAKKEFLNLDKPIQIQFKKAIEKLIENPIRKHLKYGIPTYVIKVTKQARFIYDYANERIIILHCFSTHKDYEKWYRNI